MLGENMARMANATAQNYGMADPASLMMPVQPKYDVVHQIC